MPTRNASHISPEEPWPFHTTVILPGATRRNNLVFPWASGLFLETKYDGVRTWEIAIDVHVQPTAGGSEMWHELYIRAGDVRGANDIDTIRAGRDGWRPHGEWQMLIAETVAK